MRKIFIALPLLLILLFVGFLVWAHTGQTDTSNLPSHREIKTAQASVAKTESKEKTREALIGPVMEKFIISQKKGLIAAMPDQLQTYSYEDEEAVSSDTIVVNYRYRDKVNEKTLSQAKIARYQKNYVREIQDVLSMMKDADISHPHVKSVYHNKNGHYLYTLTAQAD